MKIYRNLLLTGLAALLVFMPVARGAVRVWSITPVLLIELTLIFAWLFHANNTAGYSFKKTAVDKPILIIAILATISFIFSIYKYDSFYALLKLFGYIGIFYLVVNEFDRPMRKGLIWLVIGIGSGLSLYGLLQYFGLFNHSWWNPKSFLAATYVNHNHFAGYLELVIPVAIGILLKSEFRAKDREARAKGSKIVLIVALVIMAAAFILTQSRGAWLSLTAAFIAMIAILMKKGMINKKSLLILILIVVIISSFMLFGKETISQRMDTLSPTTTEEGLSAATRVKIWQGAIKMIVDRPIFGVGIGDFIWGFPRFRPEGLNVQANFAHNDYLEAAAEMGLAAPFIMIWLLVVLVMSAIRRTNFDAVRLGCAIGILSLALHGLVDFNFHIPANMLLFSVWAAIIMSNSHTDKES